MHFNATNFPRGCNIFKCQVELKTGDSVLKFACFIAKWLLYLQYNFETFHWLEKSNRYTYTYTAAFKLADTTI